MTSLVDILRDKTAGKKNSAGDLWSDEWCRIAADRLEGSEKLLKLIHDDLKMRADEDDVVNISDFIWQQIKEHTGNE